MIKKIYKDIQKLEQIRNKKIMVRDELGEELNEIDKKLKQLYSFKSKYEQIEASVEDYFSSSNKKQDSVTL